MRKLVTGLVAVCLVSAAAAQAAGKAEAASSPAMQAAAAAKADYLMLYDGVAKKIRDLGAAIPEEKYGWRPAEGVRSIGEVLNHVTGAAYLFGKVSGAAVPAGAPTDPEKGPDAKTKADILAKLSEAIAYGRANAEAVTPE